MCMCADGLHDQSKRFYAFRPRAAHRPGCILGFCATSVNRYAVSQERDEIGLGCSVLRANSVTDSVERNVSVSFDIRRYFKAYGRRVAGNE